MAWLELRFDLSRTADALTRIAEALERFSPPPSASTERKPAKFYNIDPGDIAEAEAEADRRRVVHTEETTA